MQILIGAGDAYCDSHIELSGEGSGFKADIGYLGQREQKLDMNLAVDHWGKSTESEINAAGALKDAAHKVFRGTIDFKNGSSASVGNEKETVLMLGDDRCEQDRAAHPLRGGERRRQPRLRPSASLTRTRSSTSRAAA